MNYSWESMNTAPEVGEFLVYIPELRRKVHVCYKFKNLAGETITIIGNLFTWDVGGKPTKWCHIPMIPENIDED